MALTAEGRARTEAHRKAQLAVAARADVAARALWSGLDVSDLDGSTPGWLRRNELAVQRFHAESVAVASAYVPMYRAAELGTSAGPIVKPAFDAAVTSQALLLAGPVRVKMLIGSGKSGDAAHAGALSKFAGIARRQVLSGGRMMINETAASDTRAVGWRRVSDGNPCSFCAMLVTRGPVYSSRGKAEAKGGEGLRYHGHCGCTAEIVYGEWKPTEREQEYIDAYNKAAEEASEVDGIRVAPKKKDGQDTILWRMRRDGLFRDSALTRNK